jgi:predicted metal-dependent hydrolase
MDVVGLRRGVDLFNRAEFFEAHEVLEDLWRAAPAAERKFLQALIQISVALHHHTRGNRVGAQSLLKRATKNLAGYPKMFAGIEVADLLDSVADWERALADGRPVPPLPQL